MALSYVVPSMVGLVWTSTATTTANFGAYAPGTWSSNSAYKYCVAGNFMFLSLGVSGSLTGNTSFLYVNLPSGYTVSGGGDLSMAITREGGSAWSGYFYAVAGESYCRIYKEPTGTLGWIGGNTPAVYGTAIFQVTKA